MNSHHGVFPQRFKKKKCSCSARLGCKWGLVDLLVSV